MWLSFKTVPHRFEVHGVEAYVDFALRSTVQGFFIPIAAEAVIAPAGVLHEVQSKVCKRSIFDAEIHPGAVAAKARICIPNGAVGDGADVSSFVPVRLSSGVPTFALQEVLDSPDIHPMPRQKGALHDWDEISSLPHILMNLLTTL